MAGVCFFDNFDQGKRPRSRVELHIHLDGAFRMSTVWELSVKKGIPLGYKNVDELRSSVVVRRPGTLDDYLKSFEIFLPVFIGDPSALERGAYELCEDQARDGVIYFEARFSPHLCSNTHTAMLAHRVPKGSPNACTPRQVVQALLKGLQRGQLDFGIKARSILCCIRGQPEWNEEVLDLCLEFSKEGVVGMDIAGNEDFSQEDLDIFKKAALAGVHRTAHAGQAGPPAGVALVMKEMQVERIGHGYRVIQDNAIYDEILRKGIHMEACPHSSLLTSAVPLSFPKHPIIRFAEDGANFSINKDDPLITGKTLDDEYRMLGNMGFDAVHIARANFNAARSSFLPEEEKNELIQELRKTYGAVL